MADLSITASDVVIGAGIIPVTIKIGATVTAGDVLVYDSGDADWILASNTSDALSGSGNGSNILLALSDGTTGQYIAALNANNDVTLGSVLSTGGIYVLSASGAISPAADATTNDWLVILGYAKSGTVLHFNPISAGVQVA